MARWIVRRISVAVPLALVAGLLGFQWWRTHPDYMPEPSDQAHETWTIDVDEQMYFGMTYPAEAKPGTITLHSAEPRIVKNTADATVDLLVCSLIPPGFLNSDEDSSPASVNDSGDVPPGVQPVVVATTPEGLSDVCLGTSGFDDEPFQAAGDRFEPIQQIIVLVSGAHSGDVEIDGIDLDYSRGHQHGTRPVGQHMVVEIR